MWYKIKKIMVGTQQVRPAGWTPWENTVLYLPLEDDTTDHSQYNRAITQSWAVTKADIGYLFARPWSWENALKCSDTIATLVWSFPYTVSLWGKMQASWTAILFWGSAYNQWWTNYLINSSNNKIRVGQEPSHLLNWYDVNQIWNWWNYYTFIEYSNKSEVYQNGQLVITDTAQSSRVLPSFLWWILQYPDSTSNTWMYWSNFIIENKARTAQEVADYYNSTKSNYWL